MKQTLKKLSAFMMAMAISGALFAQVPQKFNYQGIARDTKGNPMAQQRMTLKLTVLPTSDATEGEYEEIQSVTTNEFGLYNLQIGNGTPVKGEMKTVKWETGNKYIKVAIDPKGGNDFVDAGTTQLLSVPYAIYADKAGMAKTTAASDRAGTVSTSAAGTGTVNFLTKFTAANTIYNSQLFDNGTNIGLGTTTPTAKFQITQNTASVLELIRMQNLSATGAGRFTLYSDAASNYSTFTKYGSTYAGSYAGLTGLYPYGNLLAFGNNGLAAGDGLGRFLISTAGNAGISIFKGGTSKLKFHADFTTENVGIGGNAAPISRVHLNNTDGTTMDLRLTNTTTGQTATDGMTIAMTGNNASINNRENAPLTLGTNNTTRMTVTAAGNVELANQIKIAGGAPGAGKVLTSDAAGLASWTTPSITSVGGTTNYIAKYTPNGTTLGNSRLQDLSYGFTGPELKYNSGSGQGRIINYAPKGGYGGFVATDSASMFNGYSDSVSYLFHTPSNSTIIGQDNGTLTIGKNGKLRTTGSFNEFVGNAQLSVESPFDTAAHFTSSSSNLLSKGIVRAEYTGPTGIFNDNIAIYGKSKATNNYGYGVYGEGGYYGVYGITDSFGSAGIGAYAYGTATGISGSSDAGTGVSANSNSGNAISATTYGQNRFGVTAYSGGTNGQGVYGFGDSIGTHGSARFYGAYNEANNSTGSGYSYGTNTKATSTVGRSYGINASAVGGNSLWNSYGIYAEATGTASTLYAGYFNGQIYATTGTFGTKPFTIDHPLDPANKVLRHSSIESPDMMNIYNGNVTTDAYGYATVEMPNYFDALNENFKYQLTVIDNSNDFVMAKITKEIVNNKFEIRSSKPNVKVSWQVSGVRHDAVAKKFPVIVEEAKTGENKGHYFEPAAYGVSNTLRIGYQEPAINENVDSQALNMKKEFENKQRIEAEHKANNEKAQKNWKQQEAPKNTTRGTNGNLAPTK